MANLYNLVGNYKEFEHLYNQAETDDEMQEAVRYLMSAETNLADKVENIARLVKNFESERDTFKKEADRLAGKAKSFDNKVNSLKRYLQDSLEVAGIDKVKGELFTVSLRNNPFSLDLSSVEHIPMEFKRTPEPVVDKRELLKHIKETGETFEGVGLKRTRSLIIK